MTAHMNARQVAAEGAVGRPRLHSIDILRGLVIVLMVLDHTRDFFHASGYAFNPLDPERTTPLLYATRWITHLCAPTFVMLAGVSAYLQRANGKSVATLSGFLVKRGIWLVLLELTVVSFAWSFVVPYFLFLQVIWAIGFSMVALAALVWLPPRAVLAIGIAIVAGHNLFDGVTPAQFGDLAWLWTVLHAGGVWSSGDSPVALVVYPILPWVGVMALGYGLGHLFLAPSLCRLGQIGLAMTAGFIVLRLVNGYGDPSHWTIETGFTATVMGFLDVAKYPPSLLYVLATLGPVLAIVPLIERWKGKGADILRVYGSVPLFAYVLHAYLVHTLSLFTHAALGRPIDGQFDYIRHAFLEPQSVSAIGLPLPATYAAWLITLALLYPCCRWWAGVKTRRRDWWLSYL